MLHLLRQIVDPGSQLLHALGETVHPRRKLVHAHSQLLHLLRQVIDPCSQLLHALGEAVHPRRKLVHALGETIYTRRQLIHAHAQPSVLFRLRGNGSVYGIDTLAHPCKQSFEVGAELLLSTPIFGIHLSQKFNMLLHRGDPRAHPFL